MVGQSVPSEREAIRERLGLNDPFLVQYVRFAKNAVQGDFGYSYFYREPALEVIARHLPATLELVFAATLIIVLLSVPIGVYGHQTALADVGSSWGHRLSVFDPGLDRDCVNSNFLD